MDLEPSIYSYRVGKVIFQESDRPHGVSRECRSNLDDQNSLTRIEALGNRARWTRKRKGRENQNGQLTAVRRQIGMAESQSPFDAC